jgi:Winged helix-turn helix/DDE superfamily endonuclease
MRPPSVYAKPSCPAGCPCDVVGLLHGPHRVGARLVMILLSHQHWPPVAIAELLGCDPATVRRWIHRYNQDGVRGLEGRPRRGRPRLGSRRLGQRIRRLPEGAVVLAEDETHVNLLPWVRATWIANGTRQQVMTPGTSRRRTIFGAVDLHTGRWFYQVARKAVSATFIAFLDQLAAGYPAAPTVAVVCDNVIIHHPKTVQRGWLPTRGWWCCTGRATAPTTTRSSAPGVRPRRGWPPARP